MTKLIALLVIIIVLALITRAAINYASASRQATGLNKTADGALILETCADSYKCVSSTAVNERNKIEPFTYTRSPDTVMAIIAEHLQQKASATIVDANERYLHATFSTFLFGFIDDTELLLDDNNVLQVRSASRLGKSDLGTNRKRVEAIREMLAGKI